MYIVLRPKKLKNSKKIHDFKEKRNSQKRVNKIARR